MPPHHISAADSVSAFLLLWIKIRAEGKGSGFKTWGLTVCGGFCTFSPVLALVSSWVLQLPLYKDQRPSSTPPTSTVHIQISISHHRHYLYSTWMTLRCCAITKDSRLPLSPLLFCTRREKKKHLLTQTAVYNLPAGVNESMNGCLFSELGLAPATTQP